VLLSLRCTQCTPSRCLPAVLLAFCSLMTERRQQSQRKGSNFQRSAWRPSEWSVTQNKTVRFTAPLELVCNSCAKKIRSICL